MYTEATSTMQIETISENVKTAVWKLAQRANTKFGGFFKRVTGTPSDAELIKQFSICEQISAREIVLKTHDTTLLGLVRAPRVTAVMDFPVAIQGRVKNQYQYKLDRSANASKYQMHPAIVGTFLKITIMPEGIINWYVTPGKFNEKQLIYLTNPFQTQTEATW